VPVNSGIIHLTINPGCLIYGGKKQVDLQNSIFGSKSTIFVAVKIVDKLLTKSKLIVYNKTSLNKATRLKIVTLFSVFIAKKKVSDG
jgi:hypothetical protein